jgi:hypothetical protein
MVKISEGGILTAFFFTLFFHFPNKKGPGLAGTFFYVIQPVTVTSS